MHTILHTLSLLVVVCNEHKLPALQVMRLDQNTALSAKTEQFITIVIFVYKNIRQRVKTRE